MVYTFVRFIVNVCISCIYKFEVQHKERIPHSGAIIICSNHIHWIAPIVLACKGTKRTVHFLGKAELFKNKAFAWLLKHLNVISIKRGQSDIGAIKNSLTVLKENHTLGIFPEGTRVKEGEEKKAEAGLAMLAIKSKALVIPIGISANYKIGSKVTVNIGEPISLESYYGKKVPKEKMEEISEDIMNQVRKLVSR